MSETATTVLLIDNEERYRSELAALLRSKGYVVVDVSTILEAGQYLRANDPPTFILADRKLETGNIETEGLSDLRLLGGGAHVVVYTRLDELTPAQRFTIRGAGAIRVLDKNDITKLVDSIAVFTSQLDELLDLSRHLQRLGSERSTITSALLGADVGVTVVDKEFHCWYANSVQERLVGRPCGSGLCFMLFHGHPAVGGRCWGCTVAQACAEKKSVQRLFLSRFASGALKWVNVLSTPVQSARGEVIAVREAVTEVTDTTVCELELRDRLLAVARGVVHAGFGRARIYRADGGKRLTLLAAASCLDDPTDAIGSHHAELGLDQVSLDIGICPYANKAEQSRMGVLVQQSDWETEQSPFASLMGNLVPPYFDVPVRGTNRELCGWLSADFVDLPEATEDCDCAEPLTTRSLAIGRYANESTLQWLCEDYGREIRRAFEAPPATPLSRNLELVERARLGVGSAGEVSDAVNALREAASRILPKDSRVSVRAFSEEENVLREIESLCTGPRNPEVPLVIALDDNKSLAAHAVTLRQPVWIDGLAEYRASAQARDPVGGYAGKYTASTAHVPLQIEQKVYGSLSVDSPTKVRWDKDGYREPLRRLASHFAFLVRDIREAERLDRAREDVAALIAASLELTGGSLWRQWSLERLQEAAGVVAKALALMNAPKRRAAQVSDTLRQASALLAQIAEGPSDPPQCHLGTVISKLAQSYSKDRRVSFPSSEGQPVVAAPGFVVRHILRQLLENARQVLDARDRDVLRSGGVPPAGRITVAVRRDGRSVIVSVEDTGPGIRQEIRNQLFRGPVAVEGRERISLLCARGLARAYKGDLRPEDIGIGTRFALVLPLS
jgi:signal transduction histidine kinase/CheY-like chemotaxis protein